MKRYLGCDTHASSCTFSVLDVSGKQLRRDLVETNGQALVGYLRQIPGKLHLCIEEGKWSQWLYEILSLHLAEMVLYRGQWRPGAKNDAIDARGLAEKLRTGKITCPLFKVPKQFTPLREASRTYTMVTRDLVRTKSRIKSFYRSRGVSCRGERVYHPEGRRQLPLRLPPATRRSVELMDHEMDLLVSLKEEAERRMLKESHRHQISRILETAPGMGSVRRAQMLPIVVTPHRFRTKRQFWSYCGFGVVARSSADWVRENGRWLKARGCCSPGGCRSATRGRRRG